MSEANDYTETLQEVCARHAADWTEDDLRHMVQAFREQCERWKINVNQEKKTLASSSKVVIPKVTLAGLKLGQVPSLPGFKLNPKD